MSWWFAAVTRGLAAVRRRRPAAIFSTYPIATAHLIALTLARLTRLPWIADFRDPMIDDDYPEVPAERIVRGWIERQTIARCARAVFTTPGARRGP